jgi:hypothetical protein
MPPIKGKARRLSPLRCYSCNSHVVHVERASNTRYIHDKKRTVANVICAQCGNEWWSYHPTAIKAMREADKKGAARVTVEPQDHDVDFTG